MKLIKTNEPLSINNLNILIYGEPGSGKTSLANTAKNPVTLDCDRGAHRSIFRKDVIEIDSWQEIGLNFDEFLGILKVYDTIIIDTVDTLLDYMSDYIVEIDPKLMRNKLQFFGKLKDEFTLFINNIRKLNKDIILIAHLKEKEENDIRVRRPAIIGGSYDRVIQLSDIVGYLYINNNRRFFSCEPSEIWMGKNCANLPTINIPDFSTAPDFLASMIEKIKNNLNSRETKQKKFENILQTIKKSTDKIKTLDGLNNFIGSSYLKTLPAESKLQVMEIIERRGKELGFTYDKTFKKFVIEKTIDSVNNINENIEINKEVEQWK